MKTVWLVDSGEYSDYQVDAIFSTQEQAEEFSAHLPDSSVVEWTLNEWSPDRSRFYFKFDFAGTIIDERESAYTEEAKDGCDVHSTHNGGIAVTVFRGPRETAVKIASEMYTRIRGFFDEATERTKRANLPNGKSLNETRAILVAKVLAGISPLPNPPLCGFDSDILAILALPNGEQTKNASD